MSNERLLIRDKYFKPYITEKMLHDRINLVAEQIAVDVRDDNPLFLGILNGAFIFAADIFRQLDFPCEISFVKYASYRGMQSEGKVRSLLGVNEAVRGRHVIIIEDIIDSGRTMVHLLKELLVEQPASVRIATLLFKEEALKEDISPDYYAFRIPDKFVVGYGLDYDGYGRNLKGIYIPDN